MKKQLLLLSIFFSSLLLADENSDKTVQLDNLIEVTQQSLEAQIALKQEIQVYQKLFDSYVNDPEDKQLLIKATQSAHRIMENIKAHHLEQIFDSKFLGELNLFAQVANKRGIPKP